MLLRGILSPMNGPDFLRNVIEARNTTPNRVAVDLNMRGIQGTISRYIQGKVREPKKSWTLPVARHLGFDPLALSDERIAAKEAERMGLGGRVVTRLEDRRQRSQKRIDPGMLILQINDLMRAYPQSIKEVAAPMFSSAALCSPEDAAKLADAGRALLREDVAPRSGTAD